jgi:hypothetical protein
MRPYDNTDTYIISGLFVICELFLESQDDAIDVSHESLAILRKRRRLSAKRAPAILRGAADVSCAHDGSHSRKHTHLLFH